MFTSDDYFHITNARILNENVNHLDERKYEPDEKLPSGKTPSEKMKERENEHRKSATSQGGGSRGDAKNRSSKIGSIRGAIERGEDPRADGYGGARAARGNPPADHRAAFSKNPLNKPPRRVKEPGVKKESFDIIAENLFVEGYADTIESAELIAESISAEWVNHILDEKYVKALDTTGRGADHRTRFPKFHTWDKDPEVDPTFTRRRARTNDKKIDPYFSGRKERKDEKRKGVGGFSEAMSSRPEEPSHGRYPDSNKIDLAQQNAKNRFNKQKQIEAKWAKKDKKENI